MKLFAVIGTGLIGLALSACGGSSGSRAEAPTTTSYAALAREQAQLESKLEGTPARRPRSVRLKTNMTKAEIAKLPKIVIAKRTGPPPRHLVIKDLRKGTGPAWVKGDRVHARYFNVEYSEVRDRSRSGLYGPIDFATEQLLKGWKVGLVGMKVGGRRELVFPPKLIYPGWKPSWGYMPYVRIYVIDLTGIAPA